MRIAIALRSSILISLTAAVQTAPKERMTVVISLDGFRTHALDDPALPIPTLRALIRDGVSARMSMVNPSVTWSNHTTMVTGVRPDDHGLLVNGSIVATNTWPR
jgi:predicted AlkP superfamily pyrophosphatase or phosphodiesterase